MTHDAALLADEELVERRDGDRLVHGSSNIYPPHLATSVRNLEGGDLG